MNPERKNKEKKKLYMNKEWSNKVEIRYRSCVLPSSNLLFVYLILELHLYDDIILQEVLLVLI